MKRGNIRFLEALISISCFQIPDKFDENCRNNERNFDSFCII